MKCNKITIKKIKAIYNSTTQRRTTVKILKLDPLGLNSCAWALPLLTSPWPGYLASGFSFFTCKKGSIIVLTSQRLM